MRQELPTRGFTFAVGGIYGHRDVLDAILGEVSARCESGTVVFLGNYGLVGQDASGVIERLQDGPPAGWRWVCLRGSREQELLDLAAQGGPFTQSHLDWFAGLAPLHADAHRIYVHAALDEAFGLTEQPRETALYGLYRDGDPGGYRGRHVVHAYAPSTQTPQRTSVEQFGYGADGTAVAMFDDARPGGPADVFTLKRDAKPRAHNGGAARGALERQSARASLRSALAFEEQQLEQLRHELGKSSPDDVQRAFWPDRVLSHQRAILEYRWRLASLDTIWP